MHRAARRRAIQALGIGAAWPAHALGSRQVVRVGLTPVFLDDRVRLLREWQAHLSATLDREVEFVQRSTYGQVLDALRSAQVDYGWVCGYPYVLHQKELQLVAVPQWRGRPLYQSYLITDASSPVADLAELRGHSFAYSDPLSNSGFLYMQHLLRTQGHEPGRYFGRTFFTHSHRHVVEAVADGLARGGAVDGYVWETLAELYPDLAGRTRVVQRSPDFGFPPVVAAATVPGAEVERFRGALLAMGQDPAGRAVLADLRLDRFVPAEPDLFRSIAEMARTAG